MTAIGAAPRLRAAARPWAPRSRGFAAALAVAASAELLLVRVGSRTAIHIPALPALREPYAVLTAIGDGALVLAQALAIVTLWAIATEGWSRGDRRGAAVAALVAVFAGTAAAARLAWGPPVLWQAATLALITALAAAALGGRATAPLSCFAAAWLLLGGHTVIQGLGFDPGRAGRWMLWLGEAAALALPLAGVAVARPAGVRAWLAAGAAAVITGILMAGPSGWTLRFLTLWNLGLAGALPSFAYAVAAGTGTAALLAVRPQAWVPIALLVAAGLGLHNTYQSALAVAGLALLVLAEPPVGEAQ